MPLSFQLIDFRLIRRLVFLAALIFIATPRLATAQYLVLSRDNEAEEVYVDAGATTESKLLTIPSIFYSDTFDFALGFAVAAKGWPQEQSTTVGSVIAGSNETLSLFLLNLDLQVSSLDRLFLDTIVSAGTSSRFVPIRNMPFVFLREIANDNFFVLLQANNPKTLVILIWNPDMFETLAIFYQTGIIN